LNNEQVKQCIRGNKFPQPLELLVTDVVTYDHYKQLGKLIHSRLPSVRIMMQNYIKRTPSATLSYTRGVYYLLHKYSFVLNTLS
jgi:hypothetical protein